ncbi:hypothetical protein BLNAU_18319 [Blattamonas nauphoetae]|uniref:Mediator of RNA polymerase II transcription subunit 5 n=1 Tax=Blattamonas nauphoetae TaxID=2049346 RepID=A0ABQ9X548_9EUKA|nr:hypothetical protein BLNAU_18319 [Blattamonas nauphoetae]
MNLLSQCLQHTATFLNVHPDLIDSFLETVDLSSSPSDTPFHHDRHLNLIALLSQSSSPLFTKLSEPLLDPSFPLRSLLSPRSFTDAASSFLRMASTNPAFLRHLVENHTRRILIIALSTAMNSTRVVSDSPSEPSCLDFGLATPNWVVLLHTMAEVKMDLTRTSEDFNSLPSSLLTLLILSAASTHDELSTAAVSVFSNQFGLSTPHTEALLFATPTTFPVSDAFTPRHLQKSGVPNHTKGHSLSICAEAGCVVSISRSDISKPFGSHGFAQILGIRFAGCLVNALHSTTTLPHSFPFFSPELCGLSEQPSVWNDSSQPSALTALAKLAHLSLDFAIPTSQSEHNFNHAENERRIVIIVHLFPFLGAESQTQFLSSFGDQLISLNVDPEVSLNGMVECLVEMATVHSYHTPIALLTELRKVAELVFHTLPGILYFGQQTRPQSQFETAITEKLRTAEGEERWRLLTQLAVVSRNTPDIANELMRAENDAQALFVLSVHKIHSFQLFNLHLEKNLDAFDRVVELAGHFSNLPLVAMSLFHIADTVESCICQLPNDTLLTNRKQALRDLVFSTLLTIAPLRREGVEEGCVVGKDEVTSQIVDSCSKVLLCLINFDSIDPTPAIDSLVSLAVTTDLSLLRSILLALQEIEERTRNTPTPFSISRATAPFRGIHQSSVTQQPLSSIVSSILLSDRLDFLHFLSQHKHWPLFEVFQIKSRSLTQIRLELNETLVSDIAKETATIACLILEERTATTSRTLKSDDPFFVSLTQKDRPTTPQQLFVSLHTIIFPDDPSDIPASTFIPLAPFLTRILTTVVPSSPDRVEIRHRQDEHSQLLNNFLSLVLSLIHTPHPSTLSTPPLSSLLSVLSIALVRLDSIPSSLDLHNRFCDLFRLSENRSNPQVRQFVHALREEGMEDRSDFALDSFSLMFVNKWRGANTHRPDEIHRFSDFADLWNSDDSSQFDEDDNFGKTDPEVDQELGDDDAFDDRG